MNGKKYKIELKYADDQSDASQAAAAMEQLIKVDGLKLILSTETTPVNQAAATVADKYKVFYMMTVAWADWIEKDGYQWTADFFFTPAIAAGVPFEMVKPMPKGEVPQTWGMFTEDNPDGQGLAGGVEATAKANGFKWGYTAAATPGSKDFSSSILKLKEAGVDALMRVLQPGRRHHLRQADEGSQLLAQVLLRLEGLLAHRGQGRPRSGRQLPRPRRLLEHGPRLSGRQGARRRSSPPTTTAPPR